MTIGEHLLQVADAGLALCEVKFDEEIDVYLFMNVLMNIEDTLDQGRICIGVSGSGVEHTSAINTKMDELRGLIASRIEQCDKTQFDEFMERRALRLQSQFSKRT